MAFNPYDFFVLRPLRWAFGQTFGSKAKVYFDQNISSLVDQVLSANTSGQGVNVLVSQLTNSGAINKWVTQIIADLKIPASFRPIVVEFVTSEVKAYVSSAIAKIK